MHLVSNRSARKLPHAKKRNLLAKRKRAPIAPEDIVFGRHILQELPMVVLLLLACVFGGIWSATIPGSVQYLYIGVLFGVTIAVPIPFFALIPAIIAFALFHQANNVVYIISSDHVRVVSGLLALKLEDIRINYENIRGVDIRRSFYQRLFNLGDIEIGSSMHSGVELSMNGVFHPTKFRNIIEERIKLHFANLARNTLVEQVRQHPVSA